MSRAWRFMTAAAERKMIANSENCVNRGLDEKPVIKLFCPWGAATWYLSEYNPDDRCFFGLCDLGMGYPEMGYVSRDELESLRGKFGLRIERDMYWEPDQTFRQLLNGDSGHE